MELILLIPIALLFLMVIWARLEEFPWWLCLIIGIAPLVYGVKMLFSGELLTSGDLVITPLGTLLSIVYIFVGLAKLRKRRMANRFRRMYDQTTTGTAQPSPPPYRRPAGPPNGEA